MQLFKTILIMGAILLFAGFSFIAYEVVQRATNPDHPRAFAKPSAPAETAVAAPAATGPILLPTGSRIGQMLLLDRRLVYHVAFPDGREEIHLLDTRNGAVQILVSQPQGADATVPNRP